MAMLRSASLNRRSRMTRLWTLSPSWPANGPSLMRKVIDSVGGSTGCAGIGVSRQVAQGIGDGGDAHAGDGDDVARLGAIDRGALEAAEGKHLLHAEGFELLAVAASAFNCRLGFRTPDEIRPVRMRPR